ncbi:hypothetical protein [Micromonospora sp. WMMD714]|uniref:hypothetical protein n=1 Tax=Micromonospora sp. WMMD714 TaxID=3016097 RepID=UPI00249CA9C8|nr:hypothetical protein [Micromonospora sp. WMMD714]WFE66005.1 hypothetical protein O7625_23175 [Micromonospora sp. WMMD714]
MYGEANHQFTDPLEGTVIRSVKRRTMIVAAAASAFLTATSLSTSPAQADSAGDRGVAASESTATSTSIATNVSTSGSPGVNSVGPLISYCATGRIQVTATSVNIRVRPEVDAPLVTVGEKGRQYNCIGYALGDRYTACGVSNGNGWLVIPFGNPVQKYGYSVQACFKDVY